MSATIPMPADVAELIGSVGERVENRSLLLDKFAFHKKWPVVEEQARQGHDFVKWDEASRWSFMRIADGAGKILNLEAQSKRRQANGNNVEPAKRDRLLGEVKIAESLASVNWDSKDLQTLRARHTLRFLSLFLDAHQERAAVTIGQLEGRLAINLADSLIQNAGICLDRLFGLPFIPGSAVKGITRHTALDDLHHADDNDLPKLLQTFCTVFGTSENDFKNGDLKPFLRHLKTGDADLKGAISFLPAYPVNEAKIVVDLTNVHYPDYYRSGRPEDQSKERPQPNPFPAVETGAQFAFCLVLNGMDEDASLLPTATQWLERAITERGLGAKTASGYGWFKPQPEILEKLKATAAKEREIAAAKAKEIAEAAAQKEQEEQRKASLSPEELAMEILRSLEADSFAGFAKALADKTEIEQRAFVTLIISDKEKRERWKTWKKKKPEIAQVIESVRAKLNLPPLP